MNTTSSMITFLQHLHWDEISTLSEPHHPAGNTEKIITNRPPPEHLRAAYHNLLQMVGLQQGHINDVHLMALDLAVPS